MGTKTSVKVGSRVLSYSGWFLADRVSSISKWLKGVQRVTNRGVRIWGHKKKRHRQSGRGTVPEELLGEDSVRERRRSCVGLSAGAS